MYLLGRVVTLDEIHHRIDSLNVPQVQNFIQEYAPRSMVLVTIGPQPLNADCVSRLA
jgi:hypothetical protein